MARIVTLLILLIVMTLGLAFHVRNGQLVEINYYSGSLELTVSTLTVVSLFIGAALGIFTSFIAVLRLRHENRKLTKQIQMTEKEVQNLRALPMKDVT